MDSLRVLVVDDEENVRIPLQEYFRHRGDACRVASDGGEAFGVLHEEDFDIMVTDISMPGMDGLQLVREARALRPHMVCIILSGTGTRRDIITALQSGAFDYLEKPIPDFETFSMVINRAAERGNLSRERESLTQDLKRQNAQLETSLAQLDDAYGKLRRQEETLEMDLRQAQRMQKRLLPSGFPRATGFDVFGYYRPCERLGGDFFGYVRIDENREALYLVDVAGHGVSASMITVILRELLHAQKIFHQDSDIFTDPRKALTYLNEGLLEEDFDPPILVTMVYAVLDMPSGRVQCACAGHPPPVVVSRQKGPQLLRAPGPVLGVAKPKDLPLAETTLEEGDFLILYSDGLSESRSPEGEELGEEGLMRFAGNLTAERSLAIGTSLEELVEQHTHYHLPEDDLTFMVVQRCDAALHADIPVGAVVPHSVRVVLPTEIRRPPVLVRGGLQAGWAGRTMVVRFAGIVNWQESAAFQELIRKTRSRTPLPLLVDLSKCKSLDSTMLGLLYQHASDVILFSVQRNVLNLMQDMGIDGFFKISSDPVPEVDTKVRVLSDASRDSCSTLILSAHEALCRVSDDNKRRFGAILETMKTQQEDPQD